MVKLSEIDKYIKIKKNGSGHYGSVNHARPHYNFLTNFFNKYDKISILDLGCGTGGFCQWASDNFKNHKIYGVDPVFIDESENNNLIFKKGDSTNIPIERADIITSFDVMEHIHPDDLDESLTEISSKCDIYITKIATRKSGSKGIDEEELHPIVENNDWWKKQLERYFVYVHVIGGLFVCLHNKKTYNYDDYIMNMQLWGTIRNSVSIYYMINNHHPNVIYINRNANNISYKSMLDSQIFFNKTPEDYKSMISFYEYNWHGKTYKIIVKYIDDGMNKISNTTLEDERPVYITVGDNNELKIFT